MILLLSWVVFYASIIWLALVMAGEIVITRKGENLSTGAYIISVCGLLIAIYLRLVS